MAGHRADDGGWLIEPPEDPQIYNEILAALDSLQATTRAAVMSDLKSRSSSNLIFKERVKVIDGLHDVYVLPPVGRPPCWVVAVSGYTSRPVAAALCIKRPSAAEAERLARRVLGLEKE